MSTLADELLQDFEDSGSEAADQLEDDGEDNTAALMGLSSNDMVVDDADLVSSDEDDAMEAVDDGELNEAGNMAKPVRSSDLRSAASLVKALDFVLEVSHTPPRPLLPISSPMSNAMNSFTSAPVFFLWPLRNSDPDLSGRYYIENPILPSATKRSAERAHRKRGRAPRVSSIDTGKQLFHVDRQ